MATTPRPKPFEGPRVMPVLTRPQLWQGRGEAMRTITAKTPAGAARQTLAAIRAEALEWGYNPQDVFYRDKTDGFPAPTVVWEGPLDWPICLAMGESMLAQEFGGYGLAQPSIILARDGWFAEPVNGYSIAFYR
jgi:hypothetical protein